MPCAIRFVVAPQGWVTTCRTLHLENLLVTLNFNHEDCMIVGVTLIHFYAHRQELDISMQEGHN